ncbi:MAG: AAA family ATPase [Intrasporangium sp.]|uniref:DNA glycosylase AlkZ-like family protein n=1 Tax=Intrasporangium sp. TaxID=1925024 RepID=UPI002647D58A|nr:ATP-binding protein [Intrasporangium sp.]MDN5796976.1 AAA family ATPase [Intrasporangium sp.]
MPFRAHELLSVGLTLQGLDYAATPARGATWDDLDPAEFDRIRALALSGRGDRTLGDLSDREIARALRVLTTDLDGVETITLGAILIFGTDSALERWAPTAECLFQDLRDGARTVNESLRAPLLRAAEELENRVSLRNTETELQVGLHRVGIPMVSSATVREGLANAMVHRDYSELGPSVVQFAEDEFRIHSPGGFLPGVTLENLLEQSKPRSVVLADAFKRSGLVDRRGMGINDMFDSQLRAGRDEPDFTKSTSRSVTLTIGTGTANIDFVRFILSYEDETQRPLNLPELRLLHRLVAVGSSTAAELSTDLHLTDGAVRTTVARLVERDLVEARGNGRNRRLHTTARYYKMAEDRNAYVRLRGIDAARQDEMVVQYVQTFGSITRGQVAELCQLTSDQARTVLRRLVSAGRLALRGERRRAHYVSAVDE